MSYHQVRLRKDGPMHAVYFAKGTYLSKTRCGMPVSPLDTPLRKLFPPDGNSCKRCNIAS